MQNRQTRGQATQAELVRAARELFGTVGYEHASTSEVLRATGVSRGALYHHFESKEALFLAVLVQVEQEIATYVRRASSSETEPLRQLLAGCLAWLEMAQDPTIRQIALIDAPSVLGWTATRRVDVEHIAGGLEARLRAFTGDEQLPDDLIQPLAFILRAGLDEAVLYSAEGEGSPERLSRTVKAVEFLLSRLVNRPVTIDPATGGDPSGQ